MNHLDCKLGWMKQQARIFASDSAWVTTAANVPSLKAWYRADTTVNGGGTVSQLTDKSGNGFHLVQATGTKQPALNVADANMGGRNSITFDGVDDALRLASPGLGSIAGATIFFVSRNIQLPASAGVIIGQGDGGNAKSFQIYVESNGNHRCRYANPAATYTIWTSGTAEGTIWAANTPRVCAMSMTTATPTIAGRYRLGTVGSLTTNLATGSTIGPWALCMGAGAAGTNLFLAMTFAECIICSAGLTADQMRKIELYLAGYYGLL